MWMHLFEPENSCIYLMYILYLLWDNKSCAKSKSSAIRNHQNVFLSNIFFSIALKNYRFISRLLIMCILLFKFHFINWLIDKNNENLLKNYNYVNVYIAMSFLFCVRKFKKNVNLFFGSYFHRLTVCFKFADGICGKEIDITFLKWIFPTCRRFG